jgi:hypothetical protein
VANQVVLVGGLPRSGTTALADLLNESDDVALMAEYRLADLARDTQGIMAYSRVIESMTATIVGGSIRGSRQHPNTDVDPLAGASRQHPTSGADPLAGASSYWPFSTPKLKRKLRYPTVDRLPEILTSIVRASLDKPVARIIGSKTPGAMAVDDGEGLQKHFPDIRYVAMLRSPLGQINSSLNRRNLQREGRDIWHISSVEDAMAEYRSIVQDLIVLSQRVGDRLLFIKYEDLVSKPEETCETLFKHIGLEWRPAHPMLFAERGTFSVLTDQERKTLETGWQSMISKWDSAQLTGSAQSINMSIFNELFCPPPVAPVTIGESKNPGFLASGWSSIDSVGVWSDSERASLVFGPSRGDSYMLKVSVVPFLAAGTPLTIRCSVNGSLVAELMLCPGNAVAGDHGTALAVPVWEIPLSIWFGPMKLHLNKQNVVDFDFQGLKSPHELGLSIDVRRLGISLRSLQFVDV